MRIPLDTSQKSLATLWLIGAGITSSNVIVQTNFGRYGNQSNEVWGWLLPNILPITSLIISVFVSNAFQETRESQTIDRFIFRIAFFLSIFYLIQLNYIVLGQFLTPFKPLELMKQSSLWLGPFQGLLTTVFGAFFIQKK